VPWRTSTSSLGSAGARRGVSEKDAVVADAGETFATLLGQIVTEGDWVIASVEDEQRDFPFAREESKEPPDLCCRCRGAVVLWRDALHVEGCRPRVKGPVQLTDPLIVPAGHDGLARRMLGRRVVKASLGAALGVTAIPGRGVDGKDEWPRRRALRHEERPKTILVDPAPLKRLVETAVRTTEFGLEAESGH
jgi:hypothetical protein